VFRVASRLGDGVIWYAMLALLPILHGRAAIRPVVVMAITGVLGVLLYKVLKKVCVRERPFITHSSISLAIAPLDRYSFPSGHTLHAVCFTIIACSAFPGWSWVLVPFTVLVGLSRLVLGLHYLSDVLVGALIGGTLGSAAVLVSSMLGVGAWT
jgi:undecaprenyl-diphosphatase